MNSYTDVSVSKPSRRFILPALIIVCMITMISAWTWRYMVMSKRVEIVEPNSSTLMDLGEIPEVQMYDVSTKTSVMLKELPSKSRRLLIFLTAADCASCLDELGDWLSLAKSTPKERFEVDLIYLDTASNELVSFMTNNPLPYHVYWDKHGDLAKKVNVPPQTPVTVLVDKNFRVLAAQAPESDVNVRQPFIARVGALVSHQN